MAKLKKLETLLKEACKITDATWAASVERRDNAWLLNAAHKLNKSRQADMLNYLAITSVDAWLCGAMTGGRTRSRKIPDKFNFNAEKIYTFSIEDTQTLIVVGANGQDANSQRVWRLLAKSGAFSANEILLQPADTFIFGGASAMPYDLPRSLQQILARIAQYVPIQAGWLAIYGEDELKVEAHWNCPEAEGNRLVVESNEIFGRIRQTSKGVLIKRDNLSWKNLPQQNLLEEASAWVGIPLLIGNRLIGMIVLWREEIFSSDEWIKLQNFGVYAASSVEMFITFSEMASHLRRLAMLNDFALIVSSAQNLDQIVNRVIALLTRTFNTELIALFLLSTDRRTLRKYRAEGRVVTSSTQFLKGHPLAQLVKDGKTVRVENNSAETPELGDLAARSALIVPLKYRGDVIGVLEIESEQAGAFGEYDENLLVVIASHLAGLVEYGRLLEEAEARARNVGLIHDVIQQVIGLTNVAEVAQITADLLVQHFTYELAVVFLVDRSLNLQIEGISGSATELVKKDSEETRFPVPDSITGHVFSTGESIIANDVSQDPRYKHIPGWDVGSEMCVALQDGERVLGIIDVESSSKNSFAHNDLLALESLAGFLTSVVSSVERYQMLQDTIQILQTTQEELQDRMESQLAAENRLIQAEKLAAVGEMAAGIAHELNNPLTTVSGFSELVLDDLPEDAPQRADMEMVLREAKRARSVVRRLLDFSRQSESLRVRAGINEVIEDVSALTKHLFRTSGVEVEMRLGHNLPWVLIDRNQIKQVILNLLHNALHAMPDGGEIAVETKTQQRKGNTWLTISIQDTGDGMPPEVANRIFEPFFTTKANTGGTGLGLSVTYGIITDHAGLVDVESTPGLGSRFTVWLPLEEIDE